MKHTLCGEHARSWVAQYRPVVTKMLKAPCGRHVTHSVPPTVGVRGAVRLLGASGGVPPPEVERSVMLAQLSRFRHKEAAKAGTPAARISMLVQKPPVAWRQLLGELRWKEERRKRQQPVKPATSVSDVVAVKRISRGILLPEKKRREKAAAVRRVGAEPDG